MDDIKLTAEEAKSIEAAFSQKGFRDLLAEYMQDISDPKHREEREEYLRQLEARNDIPENKKILHPQVGYVLKFKVTQNDRGATNKVKGNQKSKSSTKKNKECVSKFFINIVSSEQIEKPSCEKSTTNSLKGNENQWSLPYSVGPIRMERDKGNRNLVPTLDCCFHPLALYFGKTNPAFRHLIATTAREGAETQNVKMGNKDAILSSDYHILRGVSYISGKPSILVIGCTEAANSSTTKKTSTENKATPILPDTGTGSKSVQVQQPAGKKKCSTLNVERGFLLKEEPSKIIPIQRVPMVNGDNKDDEHVLVPSYEVVEIGEFDLADHIRSSSAKSTRPKHLEYRIKLPRLQSSEGLVLDISDKRLDLESTNIPGSKTKYLLSIPTPYAVKDGTAKFDQNTSILKVTLPVVEARPPKTPTLSEPVGGHSPYNEIKKGKNSTGARGDIFTSSNDEVSTAQLTLSPEDCSYVEVDKPEYDNPHERWLEVVEGKDVLDCNALDEAYYKAIRIANDEAACQKKTITDAIRDERVPTSARESYNTPSTSEVENHEKSEDLHFDEQSFSSIDGDFAIIEREDTESTESKTIISREKSLHCTNHANSTCGQFSSPLIFELD